MDFTYGKDEDGYTKRIKMPFFNKMFDVNIWIQTGEERIEEIQNEAYAKFMEKYESIQRQIAEKIFVYYNEEEKDSYGPDDPEEAKEWWPEINTAEEAADKLHLESIVIPQAFIMNNAHNKGKRCVYVLFSRDWGGEDYDDNGVAVKLLNEEVVEVGYKDMAY